MKKIIAIAIVCLGWANLAKGQNLGYLPNNIQGMPQSEFVQRVCIENNIQNQGITDNMFLIWKTAHFSSVSESNGKQIISKPSSYWSNGYFAINHMFNSTKAGQAMFDLQDRVGKKIGLQPSYDMNGMLVCIPPYYNETCELYVSRLLEQFNQSN
ncbi:MAG: hypothetical protein NTX85_00670 [Candidatus Nomurabacteria bacterium]|nr:hypothetical protein [Candidatus Nomurabacteria bacterium]